MADEAKRYNDIRDIKNFIKRLIAFVVIMYLIFGVIFGVKIVSDNSMKPKLMAGDVTFFYRLERNISQGDVVFYKESKDHRLYLGRVIALPGDKIDITNEHGLNVNGSVVLENDIFFKTCPYEGGIEFPVTLAKEEYFVLADYREGTKDSRYFGPVKKSDIVGNVIAVVRKSEI